MVSKFSVYIYVDKWFDKSGVFAFGQELIKCLSNEFKSLI